MAEANQGGGVSNFLLENPRNIVQPFTIHNREAFLAATEAPDLNLQLSLGGCYHGVLQEQFMPLKNFDEGIGGKIPYIPLRSERKQSKKVRAPKKPRKMRRSSDGAYVGGSKSGSASSEEVKKTPLSLPQMVTAVQPPFGVPITWAAESASKNVALRRALDAIKSEGNAAYKVHAGLPTMPATRDPTNSLPQMIVSRVMDKGKQVNLANSLSEPAIGNKVKLANTLSEPVIPSNMGEMVKHAMTFGDILQSNLTNNEKYEMPQPNMDVMKAMPTVTTTGGIPFGKKIEGFLYHYSEGYVRIVCVCHGMFFSPAEFVKHSSGLDVVNPMKHIKVLTNTFF
ncbi:hypothetical protein RJ639_038177 [Escallonia herrerae]|uniref:Ninja-family protein n=1 Tax=Escallonia herrerae TaxID=1293975 RepID=A0AA88WN95_9ASTE|nr:hypothetical protein RJ639_038177 [Escallonia herrerae]